MATQHNKLVTPLQNILILVQHNKLITLQRGIMATPAENLASSLVLLKSLQAQGKVAIRSADLTRVHRNRLVKNGFLIEVMKGWYYPTNPLQQPGETTSWFISYWRFCAQYLHHRFGDDWILSAESSLLLQSGNKRVPRKLIVRSPKASNNLISLVHNTSILAIKASVPKENVEVIDGINTYRLPAALLSCSPSFFRNNKLDCRAALTAIRTPSEILAPLLDGGHSITASRLAGAFDNIGRKQFSQQIIKTMQAAGYDVRLKDPFTEPTPLSLIDDEFSPAVNRLKLLWESMRGSVIKLIPKAPQRKMSEKKVLARVDEKYVTDAYHSLSIEGYQVSEELIERVRKGNWNPDQRPEDKEQQSAMAARGYWLTFQAVRKSLKRILSGDNSEEVISEDLGNWYLQLFSPSVSAGLLEPHDLAGFRNNQVYIRGSYHVPPSCENVHKMMPAFFKLLKEEKSPAVRAILGHFCFVYIHPYFDGNGRLGRFLMNLLFVSAGYPWLVIHSDERKRYFAALEEASINNDISAFVKFLAELMEQ